MRTVFPLHDLDQSTTPRAMSPGSLTVSQNTRVTKRGARRKRRGTGILSIGAYSYLSTADAADSPASNSGQELSPGGALFRDTADNIWVRSSTGLGATFRGEHKRPGITSRAAALPEHKTLKSCTIAVGTQFWTFALSTTQTGATPSAEPTYDSIWYTVEDADGNVISGPTRVADGTGNSVINYCAVYHPAQGKVYLFRVYNNTVIVVSNINTTTYAASGNTNYDTFADIKWNCVDAIYDTTLARVWTVASSWNEGAAVNKVIVSHGHLNTGTNLINGPVNSQIGNPGTTGAYICSGVSYLQGQPFSDGRLRYSYWVKSAANQDDVILAHCIFNTATSAIIDNRTIQTIQSTKYLLPHAGVSCGYYSQSLNESFVFGDMQYYAIAGEETSAPTSVANTKNAVTSRVRLHNGTFATTVQPSACPGSWLAGKPFQDAGGRWYVLTGVSSGSDLLQRAFHVRRADIGWGRSAPDACRIVAQIHWPDASHRGHRWRGQQGSALPELINGGWGWAPQIASISGGCKVALGRLGDTAYSHAIHVVTIDFSAVFGRGARLYDDAVVYPGGVPVVASARFPAHDLTPLLFPIAPPRLTNTGGFANIAACQVTASFRFRDATGRITRSQTHPTPVSMVFTNGGARRLAVRTLQHIGHGIAEIELWSSTPGGSTIHLQFVIPNDPTVSEIDIEVEPERFRDDTEILPASAEGALVACPPPPCRLAETFQDRVILSGTAVEGEFLYSQPLEAGYGPEFNIEALTQTWLGRGAINAICAVDRDRFALFRRDQIAMIDGPGPSGLGGAYSTLLELSTGRGVLSSSARGAHVFRTPFGAAFQDHATGRLALVVASGAVEEFPPGVEDAAVAARLVAGAHLESEGGLWFQLSTGQVLVLDLRDRAETEASRWGNWHLWTSAALLHSPSVGLADTASGPLWLQASGHFRIPKTSGSLWQDTHAASGTESDVLMVLTTGALQFDGQHGEVCVRKVKLLGTHLSAATARVTVTNDAGTAEQHPVTTASPIDYVVPPANCIRTQQFSLTVEETVSTGEGFVLDAVAVEFQPRGHFKALPGSQRI